VPGFGGCWHLVGRLGSIEAVVTQDLEEKAGMSTADAKARRKAPLGTPTDLSPEATRDISAALTALLADVFALYIKTKNFHWHMWGPHYRDYHLLLDEQSEQLFAMTDDIAERARKIGGTTLRSIGHINRLKRIADNDAELVTPLDMLAELMEDNKQLTVEMRSVHTTCDEHGDVATASLLENWIDESERRTWFLYETCRTGREQN
jgi:starvation-inducible DNA-binding protein